MRRYLAAVTVVGLALALGLSPRVSAKPKVTVDLATVVQIVDSGDAVLIDVAVSCSKKTVVLEAFVYVNQDGFQGDFAAIPVSCTGKSITYTIRAEATEEFSYRPGEAHASAFVLVEDKKERTYSGSDTETVTLSAP